MTDSPTPKTHIAQTLLSRAHSPESTATQFTEKIKQRPLYLRPTESTATDNRSRRRLHRLRKKEYFLKHQKPRPLSAREKRESGLHDLPKDECKYAIFKGLHELWVEYMHEILDLKPGARAGPVSALVHGSKLVSADYHGAEIEVVRSSCAGRVGVKGIVVRDTKFTFVLVTEGDEMKTIPKEQTIFKFTVPLPASAKGEQDQKESAVEWAKPLVFELHGSQFENRPVDRANKKFKWRNIDYL
ncbi:hypothetical protein N7508_003211 [Penicillium antarcticum]|uniref:uncharacterized protein n=1 Tax=Penicillium antarcticum TaxID=416450 RepID=UPI0023A30E6C|nr:uncharacterized protein N7508_003211 [Penicillium antarcticum]KAJ5312381.1 hypothetical protein N7508_003211 [Penicillium antarcticum]